jgi:hypothetical protein
MPTRVKDKAFNPKPIDNRWRDPRPFMQRYQVLNAQI